MNNLQKKVYQALKTVLDPELGIDIVSLGLIYEVEIIDRAKGEDKGRLSDKPIVRITMTLTTPGCPLAPVIDQMVREAVGGLPEIDEDDIEIDLTFDPPWVPDMMSEEARAELGR